MPIPILSDVTGVAARKPFSAASVPPQEGKIYIVTGGHAGIGLETTRGLVKAGAKVYIASRSADKVSKAIEELCAEKPSFRPNLVHLQIDLSSLKSAKAAAEQYKSFENKLDGIVCNAGVMNVPYKLTDDGIEQTFQVNHLGHFAFVTPLLPLLEETGKANGHPTRVVHLSSFAHNFISWVPGPRPKFDSKDSANSKLGHGMLRYSQAKLSAILFAREINARCSPWVRSLAVHPGFVKSELYGTTAASKLIYWSFIPLRDGAISSLYALTSPEVEDKKLWGAYLVPHAKVKSTTKYGKDATLARQLWDLCEALCRA